MKNIVTIGGGTGQPITLAALREIEDINIKAIVSTLDDGGSTGRLRKQLGILPPADAYRCIIALSTKHEELRMFLRKRFSEPEELKGHRVGNLLLAKLCQMTGDFKAALKAFAEVVEASGEVLPVTTEETCLCAEYDDGRVICGEDAIDDPKEEGRGGRIVRLFSEPEVGAEPEAVVALGEADLILLGPGDLYTSILANIVVGDIAAAIGRSSAKLVYISNLMTKQGQTGGMGTKELVAEIEKYVGRKIDCVIVNTKQPPETIISKYEEAGERVIENNLDADNYNIIKDDIIKEEECHKEANDVLIRSFLRHDPDKLRNKIKEIIDLC